MTGTAAETGQRLIAFALPSTPESVPMARFHVRAVLGFHRLGEYADDAAAITSELVTNAIQHVCGDGTETIGVTLSRVRDPEAVVVVGDTVSDLEAGHAAGAGAVIGVLSGAHDQATLATASPTAVVADVTGLIDVLSRA